MSTLAQTLDAVRTLLVPLVTDGTLKRVRLGIAEQTEEFPAAEVRFGPAIFARTPEQRSLERTQARTGVVRIYVNRSMKLDEAVNAFVPIIDRIDAVFTAEPHLAGYADRFDATGHGGPPTLDEEVGALFIEVGWRADDAQADTFVQDW